MNQNSTPYDFFMYYCIFLHMESLAKNNFILLETVYNLWFMSRADQEWKCHMAGSYDMLSAFWETTIIISTVTVLVCTPTSTTDNFDHSDWEKIKPPSIFNIQLPVDFNIEHFNCFSATCVLSFENTCLLLYAIWHDHINI